MLLDGNDVDQRQRRPEAAARCAARDVAMVFQEPSTALNPVYTVGWQIAEGLRAHAECRNGREARAKAIDILRQVGIPDPETRVDYYPHQFSGGQKQRIVIAQALVLEPGLIIADEPTTALDVTVQAEILDLLRRCRDEFGTAIVLITHNMGVVADLADRVAVMYQGEIVEEADVADAVRRTRRHDYTKQLLAAVPRLGQDSRRRQGCPSARTRAAEQRPSSRPSDLRIEYPGRLGRPASRPSTASASRSARARCSVWWASPAPARRRSAGRSPASPGHRRLAAGAGQRDARRHGARPSGRCASDIGFVFQDPASQLQPAADDRASASPSR